MDRRQRLIELFDEGSELGPEERSAFLKLKCNGDAKLLKEVKALLDCAERAEADQFMNGAALEFEAQQVASNYEVEERSGQSYGQYKLLSLLGAGGMGEVYLAEDTELKRKVALKLVLGELKTKEALRRFHNEQLILANLEHPNIARLLSAGATPNGLPYIVMEYVEGERIDRYADEQQLSLTARLKLFRMVCSAVAYAHQRLVVHRDIKPSNILVTEDGTPKLLDFGIAKLLDPAQNSETPPATATMVRAMTPEYASPEQVRGEPVTTSTDIYSLGVLLYELLVGHRPYRFKSSSPDEVARVICTVEPERPSQAIADSEDGKRSSNPQSLRGDLDNIILKALRKEPSRRYASVSDFSEDIRRYLEGLPITARNDTFMYRASKFVKRNKLAAAAASLVLLTLIGGIIATAWEARVARAERARAERRFNEVRRMANSFLFELNDEIEKGPTRARAMLVKKALEYLDSLAQEAGDDRSLRLELATAYMKVANIQGQPYQANLGDPGGALASYGKAQAILEALSLSEPKNPDVLKNLSLVDGKRAWLQLRAGDNKAAVESGGKAIAKAELLLANEPANTEYLRLLSNSYLAFGVATYGDVWNNSVEKDREALESFRKAIAIDEKLSAADPTSYESRFPIYIHSSYAGYALWKIGDLTGDARDYREAFEYFRKNREIAEAIYATDPERYRPLHADSIMDFGTAQLHVGDVSGALESYRQGLPVFEEYAANDPNNIESERNVADSYRKMGEALMKAGDPVSALAHSRKALAIYENLQKLDSTSTENLHYLVTLYNQVGEWLEKMKKWSEAQENRFKALAILENMSKAESKAQLSKGQVDRLIANEDVDIAKEFDGVATDARTPVTKRRESLQQAREWYQHGLEKWQEVQAQGALTSADAGKPDEVVREIARCEVMLGK